MAALAALAFPFSLSLYIKQTVVGFMLSGLHYGLMLQEDSYWLQRFTHCGLFFSREAHTETGHASVVIYAPMWGHRINTFIGLFGAAALTLYRTRVDFKLQMIIAPSVRMDSHFLLCSVSSRHRIEIGGWELTAQRIDELGSTLWL